ncbi:MAG: DUF983 domain-containing protein [Kordiimonadaceae bacterium]|jgi:uncharacterized protein (DUF983 family)|nr:DUF983 domain-containing protein [Kordiimonadaceae bacterium]MBT6035017.1 DUF983 domain-containing protein [Kordiimonadaceae bacterium]MBT6328239.1 DUF983 domain-containing protein [Kordiimonadaceae bacterium]MBT7582690.1 DUF983 domain-containing protein [Kordiimonadaceae bacterium]
MSEATEIQYSRDAYTLLAAIGRGFKRSCPHCGNGKIFKGYLKLTEQCSNCHAPTGEIRADDLPPYLTIFLVGHIIVPLLVFTEAVYHPPLWLQMAVWPSLTLILTLSILPFIKGAAVGLMWHLKLKGDEQH